MTALVNSSKRAWAAEFAAFSIVGSGARAAQAERASDTLCVQQSVPNVAAAVAGVQHRHGGG
ncbi:hypothetical protein [Streptomyces sp. RPT161]|uniref:hypothetical protein n=1 Tax=Streptomyces sp. RPT161 TaxID=3015993 RepID=UPI0022B883E1|nr:hypothetical protein [Streptomyces sp. RPT161]